jgi:transcriptional regulator with XRE-family HTH domain
MLREKHGLSLRDVAEAAREHVEPIGFEYLSRLERGQLMPSVPKLATLAAIYERPLSELINLYEVEQLRKLIPERTTLAKSQQLGSRCLADGDLARALTCFLGALDAAEREGVTGDRLALVYYDIAQPLARQKRFEPARRYLEEGLRQAETPRVRARLLGDLATTAHHLGSEMLADLISREALAQVGDDRDLRASLITLRVEILIAMGRRDEAEQLMKSAMK